MQESGPENERRRMSETPRTEREAAFEYYKEELEKYSNVLIELFYAFDELGINFGEEFKNARSKLELALCGIIVGHWRGHEVVEGQLSNKDIRNSDGSWGLAEYNFNPVGIEEAREEINKLRNVKGIEGFMRRVEELLKKIEEADKKYPEK